MLWPDDPLMTLPVDHLDETRGVPSIKLNAPVGVVGETKGGTVRGGGKLNHRTTRGVGHPEQNRFRIPYPVHGFWSVDSDARANSTLLIYDFEGASTQHRLSDL